VTRYQDALRWLYGLESRGIKLGLERMLAAAEVRGHPERGVRYVHVAGTNGKGSVATMVESVLRTAGYHTGQFASPHLQRYVERVRIAGRPITESEAAARIESLRADDRLPALSFFEYTTMLAFEAFRDAQCDIVVLEVGLGGRLDSTNIVTPEVSVITNISLEHERILGNTVTKIAREKAGVLKPGVPCVVGTRSKSARRVIRARAQTVGAPVRWIDRDFERSSGAPSGPVDSNGTTGAPRSCSTQLTMRRVVRHLPAISTTSGLPDLWCSCSAPCATRTTVGCSPPSTGASSAASMPLHRSLVPSILSASRGFGQARWPEASETRWPVPSARPARTASW
jgi:folylpolyglutamate synthase/dihydropteroate synthase